MITSLLGLLIAFFTGVLSVLSVVVAFPEGRNWLKSKVKRYFEIKGKIDNKFSFDPIRILTAIFSIIFFLGGLFSIAYFFLFPLFIAYFLYPPTHELIVKIYTGASLNQSEIETLNLFGAIYIYLIFIFLSARFIQRNLNNRIKRVRNRVMTLYRLEPIVKMTNEQGEKIFEKIKSSWTAMTIRAGNRVFPVPGVIYIGKDLEQSIKESLDLIELLEKCTPISFERGVLSIECPDASTLKSLKWKRLNVEIFLSRKIESLTGMGDRIEANEPMFYELSEVKFLPSQMAIQNKQPKHE